MEVELGADRVADLQPGGEDGLLMPGAEEENPFLQNNNDAAAEEARKKSRRFAITSEDLCEGPLGLNALYI